MHLKPTRKQIARGRIRMIKEDGAVAECFQNNYQNRSRLNCPSKQRRAASVHSRLLIV
jgi:hypothetical protein